MHIKLWKEKPQISQDYIDRLSNIVEKWQKVAAMMEVPGWRVLKGDIDITLSHKSDIRNESNQSEEYRKGYCDGMSHILLLINNYKRAAERAGEKLEKVAQQMKG